MISLDDMRAAQARLDGVAVKTSLVPWLDAPANERWFFKPEGLQPIGEFLIRCEECAPVVHEGRIGPIQIQAVAEDVSGYAARLCEEAGGRREVPEAAAAVLRLWKLEVACGRRPEHTAGVHDRAGGGVVLDASESHVFGDASKGARDAFVLRPRCEAAVGKDR